MLLKASAAMVADAYRRVELLCKRLVAKKLIRLLPGFLRKPIELNRMLTLLSRELVFSNKFTTPALRRSATKQFIQRRAAALRQPWPVLLNSVYETASLPAAANEAYRLKLLLDSVAASVADESTSETLTTELNTAPLAADEIILTIIIHADAVGLGSTRLTDSLQSIQAQHCKSWEVWLITADSHVGAHDQSIHYTAVVEQAYQQAAGVLLHELAVGDLLHPNLLGELAKYLAQPIESGGFDVIYTDHDCLDENDGLCQPVFKSDWNPDLFAHYDYIGPAVFFRSESKYSKWLVSRGLEAGTTGLSGWQKLFVEQMNDGGGNSGQVQITHIPLVLYHQARRKNDEPADTMPWSNIVRLQYPLLNPLPKVTLIIPTRDRLDILKPCIDSILEKTTYAAYDIIIVDNQSKEPATLSWLSKMAGHERITVLQYDQPFNYAAMNNFAVKRAEGAVIGLVNNDVEVINPDWLDEMVMHACRPEIGCVGAKLYYGDGRIQHAGVVLGANGGTAHGHRYFERDADGYCGRLKLVQNVSAVTGACLLVRRELFEQVEGLEEDNLQIAWNDIDLCLKVQAAGYRNLWTPYAELYHHESVSRGRDVSPEQRKRYQAEKAWMQQRWGEGLWRDPYYNPNLTAAREDFSLNMLRGLEEVG